MCGRFDTSHLTWAELYELLATIGPVQTAAINDWATTDDARPTDPHMVVRPGEAGFIVEPMRWGLIPRSYKGRVRPSARGAGDGFQLTTFNCRTEPFTGDDPKTPWSYKFAFQERRCLAVARRWYEWTGPQGKKTKHAFSRVDGKPVWFAGIWDTANTADQGPVTSFSIMTGPSSGLLADIHTRCPVVLEPEDFATWLDPKTDARDLLRAMRPERFRVEVAA